MDNSRFMSDICEKHQCSKVFTACMICNPNISVVTIDPCHLLNNHTSPPIHISTIFQTIDGVIHTNTYDMLNTNDNLAYVNVISGGNVTIRGNTDSGPSNTLVGGKGSKPSYGPTNIIKKIEDTESEIRFYISPPRLNQHVGPY